MTMMSPLFLSSRCATGSTKKRLFLYCRGYADDLVIVIKGKFEEVLSNLMQIEVNLVKKWQLKIIPAKTLS